MKPGHSFLMLTAAVSLFLAGCVRNEFEEVNINNNEVSLSCKGVMIMRYDASNWQLGFNSYRNEYRLCDDTMGNYYILTCAQRPSAIGQKVKADLQYTTSDNIIKANNLNFEVQKMDDSGKIWLWNKSKKIGIIIQQL